MSPIDSNYPLAPSEVVYLNGEQFAKKGRLGHQIPSKDIKVNIIHLAHAALLAGFLAAESAGVIKFELSEKGGFLGGARKLTIAATGVGAYPSGTFESQLADIINRLDRPLRSRSVRQIVAMWIGRTTSMPASFALEKIQRSLEARGILQAVGEKKFIFTVVHYELTDEGYRLRDGALLSELQAILNACETERPELLKSLRYGIRAGFDDCEPEDIDD